MVVGIDTDNNKYIIQNIFYQIIEFAHFYMKINRCTTKISNGNGQRFELSRKEQLLQLDMLQKYQKFKKSSSLPSFYQINKTRFNNLTQIYRALSCDKLNVHCSKTKRNSPLHTPEKRKSFNNPLLGNNNSNPYANTLPKGKRLVLQRNTQNQNAQSTNFQIHSQNPTLIQMNVKLRCVSSKLQELLVVKNNELFLNQLSRYFNSLTSEAQKKNSKEYSQKDYLNGCFKLLHECHMRKENIKLAELSKTYSKKEDEISNLQVELKKKSIRALLDQKEIQKNQTKNRELVIQIEQLKRSIQREKVSLGVNTDFKEMIFNQTNDSNHTENFFLNTQLLTPTQTSGFNKKKDCQCWQQITRKDLKLTECLKQLQSYNKKQKELMAVLVVLRKDGIDIEQIYDDVVCGRADINEDQNQKMIETINQMRKQEIKMYHKVRKIKINDSFEADNSIISSADGISFDYQDKSLEEDVYTVRHQYICKQDLGEEMRNKLKLNFNVLYDEEIYNDETESQVSEGNGSVPTI